MATNVSGSQARQDPRQVSNTIRVNIPAGVVAGPFTTGQGVQVGVLPQGAFVTAIIDDPSTGFTGAPTFGLGTDNPPTNMIAAGATSGAVVAAAAAKLGRVYAAAADTPVFLKFSAAAAAGVLDIVIEFEGNFPG